MIARDFYTSANPANVLAITLAINSVVRVRLSW